MTPYRQNLSAPRYDSHGQDTWTHPDEQLHREQQAERDYAPAATCSMCGKDVAAVADCPVCGDEDETALASRSAARDDGAHASELTAPVGGFANQGAEVGLAGDASAVWIRPGAAEGIARVFSGDTGERRREQDAA